MPKDGSKKKGHSKKVRQAATASAGEPTVAATMGAESMGPVASRAELPRSREELTELWLEARRRRQGAPLGSEAYVQACEDVARIEVEIASVERALTPPLV